MPGYRVGIWGRLRMGRKLAKSSKRLRSSTLMLEKPPPMGVVTGPFSPTRVRSMDSLSSFGMYSWYFSNASAPAAKLSHSNLTPVASTMRTVAWMTSGPIPSPGMRVTLCAIKNERRSGHRMIGSSGHLNPPRICFSMARSPDHPITRFSFALRFSRVLGLEQVLQFGHELLYVFEVEIDGGKPDVRDFIVAAETVHDELADLAGLALALGGLDDEGLRLIDDLLQLADRHRTLLACAHQAVEYLLAVKALAAAVFLHHHVRDFVDALVGGEALLALQAFAAAADGIGFLALARIHDFVILKPAEGAFHGEYFGLAATPNCSRQVSGLRLLPRLLRRAPSLPKACAVTGVRDGRATVQREQRKQR